jgi:hypothetical protein
VREQSDLQIELERFHNLPRERGQMARHNGLEKDQGEYGGEKDLPGYLDG